MGNMIKQSNDSGPCLFEIIDSRRMNFLLKLIQFISELPKQVGKRTFRTYNFDSINTQGNKPKILL